MCGCKLTEDTWYPCNKKTSNYICKTCAIVDWNKWKKRNPIKTRLNNIKGNAQLQGHEWSIPNDIGWALISSPCTYCGRIQENGNGLDRVDSNKEYTLDNVTPCCKECNWAKNAQSVKEFKNHVTKIYKYIIEK